MSEVHAELAYKILKPSSEVSSSMRQCSLQSMARFRQEYTSVRACKGKGWAER